VERRRASALWAVAGGAPELVRYDGCWRNRSVRFHPEKPIGTRTSQPVARPEGRTYDSRVEAWRDGAVDGGRAAPELGLFNVKRRAVELFR
jgi:hypothetical protein